MPAFTSLPQVPYKTPLSERTGYLTGPWMAWFRDLFKVVNEASQIDASAAASAAAASAASASSSATAAQGYASNALTSAGNAAASETSASNSAISAAASAEAAEAAANSVAVYNMDYVDSIVTVPVHRQFITFQRVTLVVGGSLRINGRGRIL